MASDKMKAFSHPADRNVPRGISGDRSEKSASLAGQNRSRSSTASITPEEEPITPGPCCSRSSAGKSDLSSGCGPSRGLHRDRCLGPTESTRVPKSPTAVSAPRTLTPNRWHSEAELDEEGGASGDTDVVHSRNEGLVGGLVAPDETLLMPQALSEETAADVEEDDVAAADWVEATHALLEATESGQATRF